MKTKHIIKIIGYILGVLAFYFIYRQISKAQFEWSDIQPSVKGSWFYLVLALVLYVAVMFIGAVLWGNILNLLSKQRVGNNIKAIVKIHSKSNIGKYLPGNFMQFIGRNILGKNLNYSQVDLFFSTVIEIVLSVLIAVVIIGVLWTTGLNDLDLIYLQSIDTSIFLILFATGFLLLLLSYLFFRNLIDTTIKKLITVFSGIKTVLHLFSGFVFAYVLLGLCNYFILMALSEVIEHNVVVSVFIAYLISWIVGFVLPGPPGGLGVREFIFISLLSPLYELSLLSLSAIILRLINIFGDVLYFLICNFMIKNDSSKNKSEVL
jgi:hypothetical protein